MRMKTNAKQATAHKTDLAATMCIVPYSEGRMRQYIYDLRITHKHSITPEDAYYATISDAIDAGRKAAASLGVIVEDIEVEGLDCN